MTRARPTACSGSLSERHGAHQHRAALLYRGECLREFRHARDGTAVLGTAVPSTRAFVPSMLRILVTSSSICFFVATRTRCPSASELDRISSRMAPPTSRMLEESFLRTQCNHDGFLVVGKILSNFCQRGRALPLNTRGVGMVDFGARRRRVSRISKLDVAGSNPVGRSIHSTRGRGSYTSEER